MFVALSELYAKCYAFVFKNEFLSLSHTTYHITIVITNIKKPKPRFYEPKKPLHTDTITKTITITITSMLKRPMVIFVF